MILNPENEKVRKVMLIFTVTCLFCTATNKAFPLALCELSLWLLASMEINKFVQYHGYPSSVSVRLQIAYPNTWILWFTKQLDLELMFASIISLRTTILNKWTKIYRLYLLALLIHWLHSFHLVALLIGFIYLLYLLIDFIYSTWWVYLLDLSISFSFSVYSIHAPRSLIQILSQLRKEHLYISLTIHISHFPGKSLPPSIMLSLGLN